jgi:hypothetical protein
MDVVRLTAPLPEEGDRRRGDPARRLLIVADQKRRGGARFGAFAHPAQLIPERIAKGDQPC